MLEDRMKDLEEQLSTLNQNTNASSATANESQTDDDFDRDNARGALRHPGISAKLADQLFDLGFGTVKELKKIDDRTATNLESQVPSIRKLAERAGGDISPQRTEVPSSYGK